MIMPRISSVSHSVFCMLFPCTEQQWRHYSSSILVRLSLKLLLAEETSVTAASFPFDLDAFICALRSSLSFGDALATATRWMIAPYFGERV